MLNKTLLLLLLFFTIKTYAQTDTLRSQPVSDSVARGDTALVAKPATYALSWQQDTLYTKLYRNLYAGNKKGAVFMINSVRQPGDKDELFYMLAGLFLVVAITRTGFPKYFQNIFRLFFQSNYRQKQSKESLLQDNLPSLLLNIAFLLSGGLLIALLANGSPQVAHIPLWLLWLYTFGTLAVIYIGKHLFILFCGWAFNVPQFAFNYNFIVFLVNKVTGICLLPLLAIMAFSNGQTRDTAVTVALSLVLLMLLYRYVVALGTVVKNLKINAVHFFIYLCAVEILPLLVIYKLLFIIIK
ncbi:DUF4271 domain-containing protein [Ilyomonas limi]|uniref:DUF4271 domain-containing protein n=1 Tax=Ilyomonas limi TaxID=2575867 RepID=A0A4U3KVS7_9BACT|nr:DUF4271 domain-containing protein [Ilyomonas limi]TKK65704.1 DUF4271 domain-containing protein [Ilyomonas limi]